MIAATKGFVRRAGLVLAVSLPLISTQAHAVTVSVGGTSYELGSVTGSFTANSALLQSQAWWGSASLATDFATAAGNIGGGLFAYATYNKGIPSVASAFFYDYGSFGSGVTSSNGTEQSASHTYMTATASASSVPEINAGSLSQALLMLFALWLVTWRRPSSRVA